MGWKEAQRRYRKRESLADQSTEDRVARRVLRGLGLTQKQLPTVERRMFGEPDFDTALWPRVLAVWKRLDPTYHRSRIVEVVKLDARRNHNEILERLEEVRCEDPVMPVFLTMADTIKAGWAYIPIAYDRELGELTPPFQVIDQIEGIYLALQDIETYVKSFGPFELEMSDE